MWSLSPWKTQLEGGLLDLKCFAHKQYIFLFRVHGSNLVLSACLTARELRKPGEQWLPPPVFHRERAVWLLRPSDMNVTQSTGTLTTTWDRPLSIVPSYSWNCHISLEMCMTGLLSNQIQFLLPYPCSLRSAKEKTLLLCSSRPVPLL